MADIPRYNAQISQISVPSLQNFQQDQNEQIYKAVAGIANDTADVAVKLYAAEKEYEATVEGGKVTKETDLNNLPTPTTRAQQAYNDAAIAAFYTDFSVDAERKINEAAFKNQDNPAQFLVETDAYLNGVAENIPDHLKKQILRPVQMVRESKYDTLLKHRLAKNQRDSLETFQFNMWKQRKNANNITNETDLDIYLARAETTAETMIRLGGSADDAIKYVKESTVDGLNRYLSGYFFTEVLDPDDFQNFFQKVNIGTTGIKALDMMPPAERIALVQKAFDDWNKAENNLAEKNFTIESNNEARRNMDVLNQVAIMKGAIPDKTNQAFEAAKARVSQPIADSIDRMQSGEATLSTPEYAERTFDLVKYGQMTQNDLEEMKNMGVLGDEDFLKASQLLNSFQSTNRKLPEYQQAVQAILLGNPNIESDDFVIASNNKQQFLLNKLDSFVDSREVTGQEITDYVMQIQKESDNMFKEDSVYEKKFTVDGFYKLFGVKYDKISEMGQKFIYGKSINRHKFKDEVISKYHITRERADALLTYWDNIRKLEAGNDE